MTVAKRSLNHLEFMNYTAIPSHGQTPGSIGHVEAEQNYHDLSVRSSPLHPVQA